MNKNNNSQIKKPNLKMIPIKDKERIGWKSAIGLFLTLVLSLKAPKHIPATSLITEKL